MERHERWVLLSSAGLMSVFFALLLYSALGWGASVPTCVTDVRPFSQGRIEKIDGRRVAAYMVARMWFFDPSEIRVAPGTEINLYLSALDVTHGLYIEGTNVNLMAVPGTVNLARFRLDREGEYRILCHEYCGLGHQNMAGKIVVTRAASEG